MDSSTTTNRQIYRSHSCVFVATIVIMHPINAVFVMQCVLPVKAQATLLGPKKGNTDANERSKFVGQEHFEIYQDGLGEYVLGV